MFLAPSPRRRAITGFVASVLSVPLLCLPGYAEEAAGPLLTGTVYLPDGVTPAAAAAVDLMLPDVAGRPIPGSSFARAVTDPGGGFAIDPPEWPELVDAAQAGGGRLDVVVQIGELAPRGSIVPDATPPDPTTGLRSSVPDGATATYAATLFQRLQEVDGQRVVTFHAGAVDNPVGRYVTQATAVARIAWMFTDPDLLAGNEDLDDPDVVPPLGMTLDTWTGVFDGVPEPGIGVSTENEVVDAETQLDDPDLVTLGGPVGTADHDPGEGSNSCVRQSNTLRWGGSRGFPEPKPGYDWYIYLIPYKCADSSKNFDYYAFKWEGKAATHADYRLWRLKFRSEATTPDYQWESSDPRDNVTDTSRALDWVVGVNKGLGHGEVSGRYHFKAKKIHPWQDTKGVLLHTSWISNKDVGTSSDNLWNGFGYSYEVPQGDSGWRQKIEVMTWTCHWEKRSATVGWACNPRD